MKQLTKKTCDLLITDKMTTTTTDRDVVRRSRDDWVKVERHFIEKALDLDLWDWIQDPDQNSLMERPVSPDLSKWSQWGHFGSQSLKIRS
jgi:hypothetical protein